MRLRILSFLFVWLVSVPIEAQQLHWTVYPVLLGGQTADAVTTWHVLAGGRGVEANPLLPRDPTKIAFVKAGTVVVQLYLLRYLAQSGHQKLARWLGYGIGAAGASAALWNVHVGSASFMSD